MNAITSAEVVRGIRELPSLPMIVMELLNSFEDPDANLQNLADKVAREQALAAKTLRLANSSFFGLSGKVTTIKQAITILGFDSVRTLVTAAAMTGTFPAAGNATFDFRQFWQHAIGAALCSKKLAQALNLNQDVAFITGLLHDIGKLVLVTRFPAQYAEAAGHRTDTDCPMLEAERAVLSLDHTEVGRALAEHWKFPAPIQRAIAGHHSPGPHKPGEMACVIHVADAVVHALDLTGKEDDMVPVVSNSAWNDLNIAPAVLRRVFRETEAEFEEACQILTT